MASSIDLALAPPKGRFFQSLKEELKPYPGRMETVLRMVAATTITMLIVMAFKVPNAALGVFYVLAISRESLQVTVRDGLSIIAANIAGIVFFLAGIGLFGDYPLAHFVFAVVSFFLVFFVTRTLNSYSLAFGFSIIIAAAMPLWGRPNPAGVHVRDTLWTGFGIILGSLVTIGTELALRGFRSSGEVRPVPASPGLFLPDAFSNPVYIKYALRGCLATTLCYVIYSAVAWPGISVCTATCIITAPLFNARSPMFFVGSAAQRLALRLSGSFTGGIILGIGSQALLLPSIDITGFTIFFIAVTVPAAWFATSGPGFSYYGRQMALAFYLAMLQNFSVGASLAVTRDRVVGIWLGLLVMWVCFDAKFKTGKAA